MIEWRLASAYAGWRRCCRSRSGGGRRWPGCVVRPCPLWQHHPKQRRALGVDGLHEPGHHLLTSRGVHGHSPELRHLRLADGVVLDSDWRRCGLERIPDRGGRRAHGSENVLGDQKPCWGQLRPNFDHCRGAWCSVSARGGGDPSRESPKQPRGDKHCDSDDGD